MTDRVIVPPATIGMLGGGQLGRYALVAAKLMGYRTMVLDPDPNAPAGAVADLHLVASFDDSDALDRLASECDVVTTEFENPPAASLDRLERSIPVAPSASAVRIAQDRIAEKQFLRTAGFPVGPFAIVDEAHPIDTVGEQLQTDGAAVVKTARFGYDGKGQIRIDRLDDVEDAWNDVGNVACVVEALLDLDTEVSVLVARSANGETVTWPVAENTHAAGILDVSIVPATIDADLTSAAERLAVEIAERLDYVGVLAVEMFVVQNAVGELELLVNEIAPRPHNSGHWTLDASVTSQYEQQIRAICGIGLGDTSMTSPAAAMVNLLGDVWNNGEPDWATVFTHPATKLHLYGKTEPRPGRKMGHLTVLGEPGESASDVAAIAVSLRARI
ncbi:MAG: 5-(carboxyamino)imidazole ribonucleotide synthase [Ilumatobacter sp.]|jgi:5-(carboxyamino)imidazole ribonucleotide synthase